MCVGEGKAIVTLPVVMVMVDVKVCSLQGWRCYVLAGCGILLQQRRSHRQVGERNAYMSVYPYDYI